METEAPAIANRPPRDNLVRAARFGLELRAAEDNAPPTLHGHFAVFNEWTEIDSLFEGRFMERVMPGAFQKTFQEQRDRIRVLLQHGQDPQIGDKPIAQIEELREDDQGAYYEARLFDGLPELVMDGLRAGQYGASFRFSVMKDDWVQRPNESKYNPHGLPERSLREIRVPEFGPVTFGAYHNATASVRSLTDEFIIGRATTQPDRLRALLTYLEARDKTSPAQERDEEQQDPALPKERAEPVAHTTVESRTTATGTGRKPIYGMSRKETSTPWRL